MTLTSNALTFIPMYMAQNTVNGKTHYFLRESYADGDRIRSRELFALGTDPSDHIVYPGGNAFYIDEAVGDQLAAKGVPADMETIEGLFWPFVRPDIRRALEHFRNRSRSRKMPRKLSTEEEQFIRESVHPFDKRRLHYLKFGRMDQGQLFRMPSVLFKGLAGKSRDEIEQHFIRAEHRLDAVEFKSYVYVALDLQRFFEGFMAKEMPHVLNQDRVDRHFIEELCAVNRVLFSEGNTPRDRLDDYLTRYLIMFFDHDYAGSRLLDRYAQDFMFRHRFYRAPQPEKPVSIDRACEIFGVEEESLGKLTRRCLTRLYRRLAQKLHPDKGGSDEKFIALGKAYQRLLSRVNR